jgi:tRNA nucleotidyltransferase (CCA-adding enzyme)
LRKCSKVYSLALQSRSCKAHLAIGQNPRSALELFDRLGLYSTIFTDPTTQNTPEPSTNRWKHAYDCLETMRANNSPGSIYKLLVCSADAVELSWLLAALVPWVEVEIPRPSKSGGKAPLPFATLVAKEGIKASNRVCDTVTGAVRHVEEISSFKQAVIAQDKWTLERDTLGMAIRRWDAGGGHWKLQVLLAILVDAMRSGKSAGEDPIV